MNGEQQPKVNIRMMPDECPEAVLIVRLNDSDFVVQMTQLQRRMFDSRGSMIIGQPPTLERWIEIWWEIIGPARGKNHPKPEGGILCLQPPGMPPMQMPETNDDTPGDAPKPA